MKYNECPIFKALGRKAKYGKECSICPLSPECPEDILSDAMVKILKGVAKHVKQEIKRSSSAVE